jgi:hypothetical protein
MTDTITSEPMTEEVRDVPQVLTSADFDALLAEASKEYREKQGARLSLPQMLGEYERIKGKTGLYLRPMCLEVELRVFEALDFIDRTTPAGIANLAIVAAAASLYRLDLPEDDEDARVKVLGYARGRVTEEELFVPVTEAEVKRRFKGFEELRELVLNHLDMDMFRKDTEAKEEAPNP